MIGNGYEQTARHFESRDGLRLFYRDWSPEQSGCPVLCLPGLTRNSRDFDELARRLSSRYRVLTPDLRGRGFSDRDPNWRNYHPGTYVQDTLTLLDRLGIERAAVIGTSLGGMIAMLLASRDPARLAGVALNDVGPEVAPEGLARISAYVGRMPPISSWEEAVAQTREVYGASWPDLDDAAWRQMAERAYREGPDGVPRLDADPGIGRALREAPPPTGDLWEAFAALENIPTLVLRGERSDVLSEDILHRMRQRKPDLASVTVRNRGHVPLLDEPECVVALDEFLERIA